MDQSPELSKRVTEKTAQEMDRSKTPIPIGVSNRHVHLDQEHWDALFGKGTQPRKFKSVKQPGFWACFETVDLEGPKGRIEKVRLIAPHRPKTQIEISKTDAVILGFRPPVRDSGRIENSSAVRVIGPKGSLDLEEGLIVARRHIHFHPLEARAMGVKDGDVVKVRAGVGGPRELVFEEVLVRVAEIYSLEFHIDRDEANAAWANNGDFVRIV